MKKIITLILAVALIASLGIMASAADFEGQGVIKMGTATVDAKLDPAYTGSLYFTGLGTGANAYETPWSNTCSADVYFMYDSTYLYIFAEITDDDVATKGPVYCMGDNPYANDCIEFRLNFEGANGDSNHKVAIDAYGYRVFGLAKSEGIVDYDSIVFATEITATGYCVELAIPCSKGGTDMIAAGKLGFTYQLNDINESGGHQNFTSSFYGEPQKNSPFYALSTEAAVEGTAIAVTLAPVTEPEPEDTTPAAEDTTPAAEDTTPADEDTEPAADDTAPKNDDTTPAADDTAPTTGDAEEKGSLDPVVATVIAVVAVVVVAGVIALAVKKKKD